MAMFASIEKFLTKHLGGRHQAEMPEPVAKRLAEITVDPKTVTLTKKVDASTVGAPKIARQPSAGTMNYQAKMEMGGQSMDVASTIAVTQEAGAWVISQTAQVMGQALSETVVVDSATLAPKKRSLAQGPVKVEVEYTDTHAKGTLAMGGDPKPFELQTGGPLFAEGASAQVALGALPLASGYSVTFRTLDVQRQKVSLKQATVTAIEDVTVPAGTFKAYKLEVKSAEGDPGSQTLWIDETSRKMVKLVAVLPNGATMTAELAK
jgi:hypothetical protein